MKAKIGIKDIVLFTVAGLIDLFEEIHDPGDIYSNYFKNYYGFVPGNWKKQNLVSTLSQCYKQKLISKNRQKYLQITSTGKTRLYSRYPHLFWKKDNWDGKWYFILFDFKEISRNKRDAFRRILKHSGFILIQKSVWASPSLKSHKIINSWIKQEKIFEEVLVIKTINLPSKYEKTLVNRIWHLNETNKYMQLVYKKLSLLCRRISNQKDIKIIEAEFLQTYIKLTNSVINLPRLPKKFYLKDWKYEKVFQLANKLKLFFAKQVEK